MSVGGSCLRPVFHLGRNEVDQSFMGPPTSPPVGRSMGDIDVIARNKALVLFLRPTTF